MINSYDVFKQIVCCLDGCTASVKYFDETSTFTNKAIFTQMIIGDNSKPFIFNISVRGAPNKGESTVSICKSLLTLDKTQRVVTIDDIDYYVSIMVGSFQNDGVDDLKRLSMSSTIKLVLYRK